MPLTPEITLLEAVMSSVCAATAATMHWAAVTSTNVRLPRRVLLANMLASGMGGMLTAQALDLLPWLSIPPLLGVSAAGIVGHTLGPKALWWFGTGAVGALAKYVPAFKATPLPKPPPLEEANKREGGAEDGRDKPTVAPKR